MVSLATIERIVSRCIETDDGCWEWQGARNDRGYGQLRHDGRAQYVHRLAYVGMVGDIPEGAQLDHLCRNRACCNPWHLDPVTNRINALRGERPNRTHCPQGHLRTPENIGRSKAGRAYCKTCHRDRERDRKRALRELREGRS